MYRCVSIDQMKLFDQKTIEKVGSTNLMAKAAQAVYDEIEDRSKKIYIISGGGNNGGDGIALLGLFLKDGYEPHLYLTSKKLSQDSQFFFDKVSSYKNIFDISQCDYDADIIIDCILGTGFVGDVKDNIKEVINKINNSRAYVLSVDIPSGLNGQSGKAITAIKANKTIAIQFAKYGHFLVDGKDYTGEVVIKDIGIEAIEDTALIVEDKDIEFKCRLNNSNKGTYGKSTIIGGCQNYVGAIKIANMGLSALRVGSGLNVLAIPHSLKDAISPSVMESTMMFLDEENGYLKFDKEKLDNIIKTSTSIAVGMGMGPNKVENKKIIKYLIENTTSPILIDADGLNAFEGEIDYLLSFENVIITPHPKELSRLTGSDISEILNDSMSFVDNLMKDKKGTLLLKGTSTIIANKKEKYLVVNGTPALAKGGSGDTLSGVILGLLAQGYENIKSAYYGAYLCAKAASILEKDYSQLGVLASDVAKEIAKLAKV